MDKQKKTEITEAALSLAKVGMIAEWQRDYSQAQAKLAEKTMMEAVVDGAEDHLRRQQLQAEISGLTAEIEELSASNEWRGERISLLLAEYEALKTQYDENMEISTEFEQKYANMEKELARSREEYQILLKAAQDKDTMVADFFGVTNTTIAHPVVVALLNAVAKELYFVPESRRWNDVETAYYEAERAFGKEPLAAAFSDIIFGDSAELAETKVALDEALWLIENQMLSNPNGTVAALVEAVTVELDQPRDMRVWDGVETAYEAAQAETSKHIQAILTDGIEGYKAVAAGKETAPDAAPPVTMTDDEVAAEIAEIRRVSRLSMA